MADELLNAQDLITAKKHDTFHSEVVTGKTGGLSTGANIDYATNAVTGQVQKTLPKILDDLDWSYVGLFADGVTFTDKTDFAVDAVGTQWIYTGSLPFSATAGTVPSEPTYQAVHVRDHNATSNRNAVGSHDAIYDRRTTVAIASSGVFTEIGTIVTLTDIADSRYKLTSGGVANGMDIRDAGNGNTWVYQPPFYGVVPKQIGAKYDGSSDDTAFNQRAIDLAVSIGYPCLLNSGTSINTKLTYYTDSNIVGAGIDSTILKTKDNSNSDLLYSENFDSLVGTNSDDGVFRATISAITMNGNRQRAGNISGNTSGLPLKLYGGTNRFSKIKILHAAGKGMHTEWGDGGSITEGLEGVFDDITIGYSGLEGWHFAGAHDSHCSNIFIYSYGQNATNTHTGLYLEKGNARWSKVHVYTLEYTDQGFPNQSARGAYAIYTEVAASGNEFSLSHFEGAQINIYNRGANNKFIDGCRAYYPRNGFNIVNEGATCTFDVELGGEYPEIGLPPASGMALGGDGPSNCLINLTGTGQTGGWLSFFASNGFNSITVRGYNESGVAYVGTPNYLDDIDLVVSGPSIAVLKYQVFQTLNMLVELTATGSVQGDAQLIDKSIATVVVKDDSPSGAGYKMQNSSILGDDHTVQFINDTINTVNIYPFDGGDMRGYGVNNPVPLPSRKSVFIKVIRKNLGHYGVHLSA